MSAGVPCTCPGTLNERKKEWYILDYKCNYSAFSGYHRTYSDYSCIRCNKCGGVWRTKAGYVDSLPNEPLIQK